MIRHRQRAFLFSILRYAPSRRDCLDAMLGFVHVASADDYTLSLMLLSSLRREERHQPQESLLSFVCYVFPLSDIRHYIGSL